MENCLKVSTDSAKRLIAVFAAAMFVVVAVGYLIINDKNKAATKPYKLAPFKLTKNKTFIPEVIVSATLAKEGENPGPEEYSFSYGKELPGGDSVDNPDAYEDYGPSGIAVDSKENIYVMDNYANRIKKYDNNGKFIQNINLPVSGAEISRIAIDSKDHIYLLNSGQPSMYVNYTFFVSKIDKNGNILRNYKLSNKINNFHLYGFTIVQDVLYVSTYIQRDNDISSPGGSNLFALTKNLSYGFVTIKLGTASENYSEEDQLKSITNGMIGQDNILYRIIIRDKKVIVKEKNVSNNKEPISSPKKSTVIKKPKNTYFKNIITVDKLGNVYHFSDIPKAKIKIRKFTNGTLVSEGILPQCAGYFNEEQTITVSDQGNLYYVYTRTTDRHSKGELKIIKCTLK